ncbi:MAG: hypothetical protein ABIH34_05160 [Nanoarchaeota archaeon]
MPPTIHLVGMFEDEKLVGQLQRLGYAVLCEQSPNSAYERYEHTPLEDTLLVSRVKIAVSGGRYGNNYKVPDEEETPDEKVEIWDGVLAGLELVKDLSTRHPDIFPRHAVFSDSFLSDDEQGKMLFDWMESHEVDFLYTTNCASLASRIDSEYRARFPVEKN